MDIINILRAEYKQRGTLHIFGLVCDDEHHLEDRDFIITSHWQQSYYNNSGSPQHAFSICLVYIQYVRTYVYIVILIYVCTMFECLNFNINTYVRMYIRIYSVLVNIIIIIGTARITNRSATVTVNGLQCGVTYTIITGGTLNGGLVGPRSSHGSVTTGPCPVISSTISPTMSPVATLSTNTCKNTTTIICYYTY